MRRLCVVLLVALFLFGCSKTYVDRGVELRNAFHGSKGVIFSTEITADYGDKLYTFIVRCTTDKNGTLSFVVVEPTSIADITGFVDETGGKITFDDRVLAFPSLADDLITPVSAPWLFVRAIRSGCIKGSDSLPGGAYIMIEDSFRDNMFEVVVACDQAGVPNGGEIIWEGRRIITLEIEDFAFL